MGIRRKVWVLPSINRADCIFPVSQSPSEGALLGFVYEAFADFDTKAYTGYGYNGQKFMPASVKGITIYRGDLKIQWASLTPVQNSSTGYTTSYTENLASFIFVRKPTLLTPAQIAALNTETAAIPPVTMLWNLIHPSGSLAVAWYAKTATSGDILIGSIVSNTPLKVSKTWTESGNPIPLGTKFQIGYKIGTGALTYTAEEYYFGESMDLSCSCIGTAGQLPTITVTYFTGTQTPKLAGGMIAKVDPHNQPWALCYGGVNMVGSSIGFARSLDPFGLIDPDSLVGPEVF